MGSKIFFPGADCFICLHSHTYADNIVSFIYLITILHSEATVKAEVLYRYIMCDDAVTESSSAEMNRVLNAQLQANVSHGEDATLLLVHF